MREYNYVIGRAYIYPQGSRRFILQSVGVGVYVFQCGHRVTDNVFGDMIDTVTGVQVYQDVQLKMEL